MGWSLSKFPNGVSENMGGPSPPKQTKLVDSPQKEFHASIAAIVGPTTCFKASSVAAILRL